MASRGVFIAWSRLGRRTVELSSLLGLELVFIDDKPPYVRAWLRTEEVLRRARPRIVMAQLPQGPLLLRLALLKRKLGFKLVADVHTGFIVHESLQSLILNAPFTGLLKRCDLVVVHNPEMTELMKKRGIGVDKMLVVYDPVPVPRADLEEPGLGLEPGKYIVFPASWASDEPLRIVVDAFKASRLVEKGYSLVITGDHRRAPRLASKLEKTRGVVLSGFLPGKKYAWLLSNAALVLALTTREYTLLSALWEAVGYNRPALVSETRTLRGLLGSEYPCYTKVDVGSLARSMMSCLGGDLPVKRVEAVYRRLRSLSATSIQRLREALNSMLTNS